MRYKIFGKTIQIDTLNDEMKTIIENEFYLYPKGDNKTEIEIEIVEKVNYPVIFSNSPKIHSTFKNGFIATFPNSKISYIRENNVLKINVEVKQIKKYIQKFNKYKSMAYKSYNESITAILYELVIVPFNYFFEDNVLIHASSMKDTITGKTIMFGGTGGVGKTSLELLLCREMGYSFISDDIAVMDKKGYLYPNLSYPKIYAYNAVGNSKIQKAIFKNRSFFDRVQWILSKNIRGLNKARRTIAPNEIYKSAEVNKNKLNDYYILSRDSSINDIKIIEIDSVIASKMTLDIIKNEYFIFNKHVTWHEYNASLLNIIPVIKLDSIFENWLKTYNVVFEKVNCYNVKIPNEIKHDDFINSFKSKFYFMNTRL